MFSLCFSDASIAELREVLGRFTVSRPEIRDEIRDFLAELPQLAERVSLPPVLPRVVANDPDDDVIVATAVAGKVDAIVSGDADLLALGSHARIPVLSPRQFIDWLSKQAPGA